MTSTRILTAVILAISLYLLYYLYSSIQGTIETRENIAVKEQAVIEQLRLIRDSEILFQEMYGRYTSNWDSLVHFIEHEQIPIIERKEQIVQKAYGGEDIIVTVDTLGFISAKSRIFQRKLTMAATDDGVFMGFKVKVGDRVIKNQRAYSIKIDNKVNTPPFSEDGTISSLADVSVGKSVEKGEVLINFSKDVFDPKIDISQLGYKPGTKTRFDIFTGTVNKNGLDVDVIEVKDPAPDDPTRKESNVVAARRPLRFGAQTETSTAGNWE